MTNSPIYYQKYRIQTTRFLFSFVYTETVEPYEVPVFRMGSPPSKKEEKPYRVLPKLE